MTRTAIGGIAAAAFILGILAGLVLPGNLTTSNHDQLMSSHMSAMGSMAMMEMGSMPMMDMGSMPMAMVSGPAGHQTHHASREPGR